MRLAAFHPRDGEDAVHLANDCLNVEFITPEDHVARRWVQPPKNVFVADSGTTYRSARADEVSYKDVVRRRVPPRLNALVKVLVIVPDLDPAKWRRVRNGKAVAEWLPFGVPPLPLRRVSAGSPKRFRQVSGTDNKVLDAIPEAWRSGRAGLKLLKAALNVGEPEKDSLAAGDDLVLIDAKELEIHA